MTEPFKFVVSNDPAKARQAIGTLGVPADYDVSGSGDYMVNDVVHYTDPSPSPTTDFTGLYACIVDHTSGSPKDQPGKWELVSAQSWAGLTGKPEVVPAAVRNGTSDDRAVLAAADASAVSAGNPLRLLAGTYRVASNLTITSPVHFQGAILKPDNGVTITLAGDVSAPLSQIFDHSAGGKVVPRKVPFYHPGWWGPTGTADDSQAWKDMMVAADAYSAWQPAQQRVLVPAGDNRLWEVELADVHLQGNGRSSWIKPPATAAAGDPVGANTGYMVRLRGTATVDGVDFDTNNKTGITAVFWTGSEITMTNGRVMPRGANTIGIWIYTASGSLQPKLVNMNIVGSNGNPSGVGIKGQSDDGELTNVTIYYCSDGLQLSRASWVLNAVHIWSCTGNGITGSGANDTRIIGCYLETCGGWGAAFDGASNVSIDAATKIWANGADVASTGGVLIAGDADKAEGCRIDARFDDNYGTGLYLKNADYTTGDLRVTSTRVRVGSSARCTDGVYIDSDSVGTDIRVRTPDTSPVTNLVVNNQGPTPSMVDHGATLGYFKASGFVPIRTQVATTGGTTTLTASDTQVQEFTGTSTQTVKLPSTGVTAWQSRTIMNSSTQAIAVQSSDGTSIVNLPAGRTAVFMAKVNTPTTGTHWSLFAATPSTGAFSPVSLALRDANSNLFATNFMPGRDSTVTAAETTTLTIGNNQVQEFTGTSTQTVKLPSTSVTKGMSWTIINNSSGAVTVQASDGTTVFVVQGFRMAVFTAKADTPTTNSQWAVPVISSSTSAFAPATVALRDANSNLFATNFIALKNTTVTSGGTLTMSVGDAQVQLFSGTTTHAVKLPTTAVTAGQQYTIINNSSGVVTVQSSGANTIDTVAGGSAKIFMAQVDTPTTAAHWRVFTPSA